MESKILDKFFKANDTDIEEKVIRNEKEFLDLIEELNIRSADTTILVSQKHVAQYNRFNTFESTIEISIECSIVSLNKVFTLQIGLWIYNGHRNTYIMICLLDKDYTIYWNYLVKILKLQTIRNDIKILKANQFFLSSLNSNFNAQYQHQLLVKSVDASKVTSVNWFLPITSADANTAVRVSKSKGLLTLPHFTARKNVSTITEATCIKLTVNYFSCCFLLLFTNSTHQKNIIDIFASATIENPNIEVLDYSSQLLNIDISEFSTEDLRIIQRTGLLFLLSMVKPSIRKDTPTDQGPEWEKNRYQSFLARLGNFESINKYPGLNVDIDALNNFWAQNFSIKSKLSQYIMFSTLTNENTFMASLVTQFEMVAVHHDTLMFSFCLKFAEDMKTEVHLIPEVLSEVRRIRQAKETLINNLRKFALDNKITKEIPISYYTCLLVRDNILDISKYPTLTYCVNLELMAKSSSTFNQIVKRNVIPECSEERLKTAIKIPIARKSAGSSNLSQDDLDLLDQLGADTSKLTIQPVTSAQVSPQIIQQLKNLFNLP